MPGIALARVTLITVGELRSRYRAAVLTLLTLLLLPARSPAAGDVASAVLASLDEARAGERLVVLDRREALDRAALRRARRIAELPEADRMSLREPVEDDLRVEGIVRFHRARLHLDMQHGGRNPARGILERWRGYATGWEEAMSPDVVAAGAATVRAADGWLIFVAILVEDQDLPDELREVERRVREEIDRIRADRGLAPLEPLAELAEVARGHSADMAARDFFDHLTPEGEDLEDRLRRAGIPYRRATENISLAGGVKDPVKTTIRGWMDSRGHRVNILDPLVTRTGVGVATDGSGTLYFTQVFVRPPG